MMRRRSLAVAAALTTLAVLAGGGAASASWNAVASLGATASATTVSTSLAQSGGLNTSYRYTGNSSTAVTGTLTITNNGGAPLAYTLASRITGSSALAQKTTLTLWTGTCGSTIPADKVVSTTLANPAPALPEAARTLAPGASIAVCVATRIAGTDASSSNGALQGQSVSAAFSVSGAVGTSWTATSSTDAITQSVYRIAATAKPVCSPASTRSVTLTWNAPANRVGGASTTYRVIDTATNGEIASVVSAGTTASVTIDAARFGNGRHSLAIEARDDFSGSTSVLSVPISVVRASVFFFFPTLECA